MNLLRNAGAERGDTTAWTTDGTALAGELSARTGTYGFWLIATRDVLGGGPNIPASIVQTAAVEATRPYVLTAWVRCDSGPGSCQLLVADAVVADTGVVGSDPAWLSLSATVNPGASALAVKVLVPTAAEFSVDDISLEDAFVAKTALLRAALLADLAEISVADGYSVTVTEVGTEPKRVDEIVAPAVWVTAGSGGTAELEVLGNQTGLATQSFALELLASSKTELDNLTDDVRNAIERTGSAVSAVADVEYAGVSEWTDPLTSDDVAQQRWFRGATVSVRYLFGRGSV